MFDTCSVIVATYGDIEPWETLSKRALQSVALQTHPPEEIHRIHKDTLHEARNEGAILSKSDWLCFLDADDELEPDYIREMTICRSRLPSLCYPRVRHINDPSVDPMSYPAVSLPARPLYTGNYMVIGTLVLRNQFIKLGGFRNLPAYEDWDLWIRCCVDGATPVLVHGAIYRAHLNRNGRNQVKNPGELCKQIITHNKINVHKNIRFRR
jgi:glycosyltransferase involved in cell wall biosynthesis